MMNLKTRADATLSVLNKAIKDDNKELKLFKIAGDTQWSNNWNLLLINNNNKNMSIKIFTKISDAYHYINNNIDTIYNLTRKDNA